MDDIHEANRACWNAMSDKWQEGIDKRGIWKRCHREPELVLSPAELSHLGNLSGVDVCVLGSGDNQVVFALAGMGGRVTSVDISERQLATAEKRATSLGLDVAFIRADVTDLSVIGDASFDVVYTGGHVSVWVSDIRKYYAEAARVLRPGGLFMINEYHPIRRMWLDGDKAPCPTHRYFNRGPYEFKSDQGLRQAEFHWTVADHIQAVIDAGCIVTAVDEFGEEKEDQAWDDAGLNMLPACLLIVARAV